MLQRLEEVRKYSKFGIFGKKRKMNLVKEKTNEIHITKELTTLENLFNNDIEKFMAPQDDREITEDTDVFLNDVLGYDQTENFQLSNGFKSFPSISPISGKIEEKEWEIIPSTMLVKQNKAIPTIYSNYYENAIETKIDSNDPNSERSEKLSKRMSKPKLLKLQNKASRNKNNFINNNGSKTEALPSVGKKMLSLERNKPNSKVLIPVKGKPKIKQLAVTNGSNFPARKGKVGLVDHSKNVESMTSRRFAPKLNKDLPTSPVRPKIRSKRTFGATKRSVHTFGKR
jgi:hypothetical protein